ncbi:acyltransferase [Paenibacillus spiritus]|uniref:Acyltransferase n=1 Tax=Paenibacillus spiritus TaxID=2496557 RepID=A0A5J5GI34_9BACL|nr:acyltransferase [Paenibacillus spiritus]KAA9007348.1 acyltransferase [Paenibacillus spiritus]
MLKPLTSFRFIAALMVFLFHTGVAFFVNAGFGHAGVQFFFILSGFILTYNYSNKFRTLEKEYVKKFYKARFAKIYPMHLLTFFLSLPLFLSTFHPDGLYSIKLVIVSGINLLLLQGYVPSSGIWFNFNNVSWTLSAEAFFYFMFPFIMFFFSKISFTRNAKKVVTIVFLSWAALFTFNLILTQDNIFYVWILNFLPFTRIFEFVFGMILGNVFIELSERGIKLKSKYMTLLEFTSLALLVLFVLLAGHINLPNMKGQYYVPVWGLMIFIFAYGGGVISKMLSHRFLVFLGEISFSFYILHALVLNYIDELNLISWLDYSLSLIVTIGLASLSFRYYEEPIRKLIRFGKSKNSLADVSIQKAS